MAHGRKTGGRRKGSVNKLTANIKQAIEAAFAKVGGADYLEGVAREQPQVFCQLLGRVLPVQNEHSGTIRIPDGVDRPPRESRAEWMARRNADLLTVPAAGSAE